MQRIKPAGCGYTITSSGTSRIYKCTPAKTLNSLFAHTYIDTYATTAVGAGRGSSYYVNQNGWVSGTDQGTIDNYAQIPQAFEGFVMTLTPILDMQGGALSPEVPELECRVNFDPFVTTDKNLVLNASSADTYNQATAKTGFLDMYNQVTSTTDAESPEVVTGIYRDRVYMLARTDDELSDTVIEITGQTPAAYNISTEMKPLIRGATSAYEGGIGYRIKPAAGASLKTLTAGPGILEPMLDTEFPHINLDTITAPDALGDFTMWEFDVINQWKKLVDLRLNNLTLPRYDYGKINGLLNLINADNKETPCINFKIKLDSGYQALLPMAPAQIPPSRLPVYTVTGGVVQIDDKDRSNWITGTVSVSYLTEAFAPCDFYLDIWWDSWTTPSEDDPEVEELIYGYTGCILSTPGGYPVEPDDKDNYEIYQDKYKYPHTYVYIGRVKRSTNASENAFGSGSVYTLYEVEQGECIEYLDLTKGGGTQSCEYRGPFTVHANGNIDCLDCPQPVDTTNKCIGYYSLNGVGMPTAMIVPQGTQVTLTGATTPVFLNVSAGTAGVGADIETSPCTQPACYCVLLGYIDGAESQTIQIEGSTETEIVYSSGTRTTAHQMQYGNVYVDGRWM